MEDDDDLPIEQCWDELLDRVEELVGVADDYSFGCIALAWRKPDPGQPEQVTIKHSELSTDERNRMLIQVAMGVDPDVGQAIREMLSRAAKRE